MGITVKQAKLAPLQCLLADQLYAASTTIMCKLPIESDFLKLLEKLNIHSCFKVARYWSSVGISSRKAWQYSG